MKQKILAEGAFMHESLMQGYESRAKRKGRQSPKLVGLPVSTLAALYSELNRSFNARGRHNMELLTWYICIDLSRSGEQPPYEVRRSRKMAECWCGKQPFEVNDVVKFFADNAVIVTREEIRLIFKRLVEKGGIQLWYGSQYHIHPDEAKPIKIMGHK